MDGHVGFWPELAGKIGPPIFSATLVVCLIQRQYEPTHWVLLAIGLGLMVFSHWREQHRVLDRG